MRSFLAANSTENNFLIARMSRFFVTFATWSCSWLRWSSKSRTDRTNRTNRTNRTDRTDRIDRIDRIDRTLKLDFPGNLCRAAFAILAMFYFDSISHNVGDVRQTEIVHFSPRR